MYVGNEISKMQGTPVEIQEFTIWLSRLGYAESTIESYKKLLGNFFKYLKGSVPTQKQVEAFNHYLHQTKSSGSYIESHLNVINKYSEFLEKVKKRKLVVSRLVVEKKIKEERTIFSQQEIKSLFSSIEDTTPLGLMDKAILSLYYGCGLRCKEGINIELNEVNYSKRLIYVKPSKNYHSRYVPMSKRVMKDLQEYEKYARKVINPDSDYLLVGKAKEQTYGCHLNKRLKRLIRLAGIEKRATLHSLRHSIATHLLQQGMDLEYIGRFLGHKSLDATQVYVRMNEELMYETEL
jgi:site-specific recombinase XerD